MAEAADMNQQLPIEPWRMSAGLMPVVPKRDLPLNAVIALVHFVLVKWSGYG